MPPADGGSSVGDTELGGLGEATGVLAGDGQSKRHHGAIPKVRAQLRRVAGDLFTPHTVSIGPYHQVADSWLWTPEKKRALEDLKVRHKVNISGLTEVLDGVQTEARRYYTHLPDDHAMMDSDKFCKMLLHDGCYLLSRFVDYTCEETTGSTIEIEYSDNTVMRDILYLLENQIPLLVIDEIAKYLKLGEQGKETTAIMCIAGPVEAHLQAQLYISRTPRVVASSTSCHLLDLVYSYLTSQQLSTVVVGEGPAGPRTRRWRRATEYRRYADMVFKPLPHDAGSKQWTILDVDLDGGSLTIPLLRVDSNTWTLLRNLMALEEHKEARPVTAYRYFMSQVACTAEDVELLHSAKVIEHFLGSNEAAAKGFASLCDGVALDIDNLKRNYLKPTWHAMEDRCGLRMHNFKGFFCDKYCSNVFYVVVFLIASVVFVCQVVQTICTLIDRMQKTR